ncbi:hypothetical protein ACVWY5_000172 [Bradyrhizobium sp. USDA 3256]
MLKRHAVRRECQGEAYHVVSNPNPCAGLRRVSIEAGWLDRQRPAETGGGPVLGHFPGEVAQILATGRWLEDPPGRFSRHRMAEYQRGTAPPQRPVGGSQGGPRSRRGFWLPGRPSRTSGPGQLLTSNLAGRLLMGLGRARAPTRPRGLDREAGQGPVLSGRCRSRLPREREALARTNENPPPPNDVAPTHRNFPRAPRRIVRSAIWACEPWRRNRAR